MDNYDNKKLDIYFDNISDKIETELRRSNKVIRIAVAFFTSKSIFDILMEKLKEKVIVELIITDSKANKDKIGNYHRPFHKLQAQGGKFKVLNLKNDNFYKDDILMHHKFAVIDNKTVLTGSYNYSVNAETHFETLIKIVNPSIASEFTKQFRLMFDETDEVLKSIRKKEISSEDIFYHLVIDRTNSQYHYETYDKCHLYKVRGEYEDFESVLCYETPQLGRLINNIEEYYDSDNENDYTNDTDELNEAHSVFSKEELQELRDELGYKVMVVSVVYEESNSLEEDEECFHEVIWNDDSLGDIIPAFFAEDYFGLRGYSDFDLK